MVKVDLPGVHAVTMKFGGKPRVYYYHRASRVRLPDDPANPEFAAKLAELNRPPPAAPCIVLGSVGELITQYRASPDYTGLAPRTRRDYGSYLDLIGAKWRGLPSSGLRRKHVMAFRDTFAATPTKANDVVAVLRLLLSFAVDRGLRADNPALRPRRLKTGPGHKAWSIEDVATARASWEVGEPMRTALELGLGTGQRKRDVLRMNWSAYHAGMLDVVQGKTGTALTVPAHVDLRAYLDALPKRSTVILTDRRDRPYLEDNFRHQFRAACDAAKLEGMTFHGLRHAAGVRLAEAGCSDAEIMAILGHKTASFVARYRRQASQKRLAMAAMVKLDSARKPFEEGQIVKRSERVCKIRICSPGPRPVSP